MSTLRTLNIQEHIKKRPEIYLNDSNFSQREESGYVIEDNSIKKQKLFYCPPIVHFVEELINNSTDSFLRSEGVTYIKVNIQNNCISVENDFNREFPIDQIPRMFGKAFTSTNFDDTDKKNWTGRNGLGVKIVNVFSESFLVEVSYQGTLFGFLWEHFKFIKQTSVATDQGQFIRVSFKLDPDTFKQVSLENETKVIEKRLLDISEYTRSNSISPIDISLNNRTVASTGYFEKYTKDLYLIHKSKGLEVYVSFTYPQNITLVNSLFILNGTHIKKIRDKIIKDFDCERIKNKIKIFGKFTIENPSFKSQTKKDLSCNDFEVPKLSYSEEFQSKIRTLVSKSYGGKLKVLNHSPALKLNTPKSSLILTEGLSAKSMILSSLDSREYYGVYPLKGKILNVFDRKLDMVLENKEISEMFSIIGLETHVQDVSINQLHYQRVIIATDQDEDGLHITGLIINLFMKYFPSLIEKGFLKRLNTPLIIASNRNKETWFFNKEDYEMSSEKFTKIEFNKGLGSIDRQSSKKVFRYLDCFLTDLRLTDRCIQIVEEMFSKTKTEDRKELFKETYDAPPKEDTGMLQISNDLMICNPPSKHMTIYDFFRYDYFAFPKISITRAIPGIYDGLKESQRKILYSMFNKKQKRKLINIAGEVMKETLYHHGDASLTEAITKLGQDFTGSNNICFLDTRGHFGTRRSLGKDASKPRYIEATTNPIVYYIFRKEDQILLEYVEEESQKLEPITYYPIIPNYFLNGCNGIGFGYKSFIINFKPIKMIDFFIECIEDLGKPNMRKRFSSDLFGYTGFKGTIEANDATCDIVIKGLWTYKQLKNKNILEIKDIPPLRSIDSIIQTCIENNLVVSDNTIDDIIDIKVETKLSEEQIVNLLGLEQSFNYRNLLNFIDEKHNIKSFPNIISLVKFIIIKRLDLYSKRKMLLLEKYSNDISDLQKKIKFMEALERGEADYRNISSWLEQHSYLDDPSELDIYLGITVRDVSNIHKYKKNLSMIIQKQTTLSNTPPDLLWINELKELRQQLTKSE